MFLAGVSTRRGREVLKPIYCQEMISAQTVSRISKGLDKQVEKFHRDGIYLKAKSPIKSMRRCILVAYGIKKDGTRELIDFKLARKGESEAAWESFLTSLYNLWLKGENLKIVVTDGNDGLINAVDLIWPKAAMQRCWAHKLRNAVKHLPRKLQRACSSQAREIYAADNKKQALKAFKNLAKVWRSISGKAVDCLEEDLEELLNFYDCPKQLWVKIRTTNVIERQFREVRRRTKPTSCFTNTQSVERIIFAIFNRQNNI